MAAKYETDFYGWVKQQAALLRDGRFSALDVEHLIEEVESMGKSEKRELLSRLSVLLAHLLKWHIQPGLRSRSWSATIEEQRKMMHLLLEDDPSLKAHLPDLLPDAYEVAVLTAERETGLPESAFPTPCPYTLEQITDEASGRISRVEVG